mmetsp:Transcript_49006/g.118706  ORF Transcript_49006/g.118706 Transcript_49006/m.118706 type:complete len:90 (-) Transcript_49006:2206-2475(-)
MSNKNNEVVEVVNLSERKSVNWNQQINNYVKRNDKCETKISFVTTRSLSFGASSSRRRCFHPSTNARRIVPLVGSRIRSWALYSNPSKI